MPDDKPSPSQVIFYQTEDGRTHIETRFTGETAWLSLNQITELFQRDKSVISKHIKKVFEEGELKPEATVAKLATVETEGGREVARDIEFYNLDVIISVGYRVKSHRGTQFRIWATQRLETRALKQAVRRNLDRFPSDFMFELADDVAAMVSQNVIPGLGKLGGARPMAFTERGVAMRSSVLRGPRAVHVVAPLSRGTLTTPGPRANLPP